MYKRSFLGSCLMAIVLLLVSSGANAQTTHPITNTEANALETFIESGTWAAGDIIMLTSPGVYEVADIIDVTKNVTIMGDPTLPSRPVINFTTTNNTIRANAEDLSITIKGIDFNGYRENNTNRANAIFRANSTIERVTSLVLQDSKAWGFIAGVDLNTTNYKTVYENVLINNVDWSDFGGSTSIYAINLRLSAVKNFRVANSTFHKLQLGFISPPYYSNASRPTKILQHYLFENNTFYKVAGISNGSLIQFNDPTDNSVKLTFRNNIVSTLFAPDIARPFRINAAAAQPEEGGVKPIQIFNNIFHDYNSPYQSNVHNLATVAARPDANVVNNITSDPLFMNPERGDFTLKPGSPARTASNDGGPVGDMQWFVGVHSITNADPTALKTFIETGTWAAGDIIMLASTGVYEVANVIDIPRSVTIMGNPALATRPVINFTTSDNTFRANANDLSITIKGIDFNGYRENNTNRANAIFRANSTIERVTSLVLEDSKAWGFIAGVDLNTTNYKTVYENVLINNVDWSDFGGSTSIYAINLRLSAVKNFRVANSTFHKLQLGFISPPYYSNASRPTKILQHYLIENNTFYKVAGISNGSLIQFNDPTDNSVKLTFRNNIVSTLFAPDIARPFRINAAAGQPEVAGVKPFQIVNNDFHDYDSPYQSNVHNLATVAARPDANVANNLTVAPGFADPENGNFRLSNGSPLLTAGTNGGPIGDPEWVAGLVTSTKTELAAAKIEVYPNPVRDVLFINAASVVEVTLYNISGSVVLTQTIDRSGSVKIANIKPGLYIARITAGNQAHTVKIVKE